YHRHRQWPDYADSRIVISQSSLGTRPVVGRMLVDQAGVIVQGLKTMGESARYIDHPVIAFTQLHSEVMQVGGGVFPQINRYIIDSPPDTPDNLGFHIGRMLIMKPSDCTFLVGDGMIGLDKIGIQASIREFTTAKYPGKETPIILERLQFNKD